MDNKKFFIILTIVLCLNFLIGTTALVLAAIPLLKQSSSNVVAQGQQSNQQNWRTYGAGQQPNMWQSGGQQGNSQQPGWNSANKTQRNNQQSGGQQSTGPQVNMPQSGAQGNQRQFAGPQSNMPQFGAQGNQRQFAGPQGNMPQFGGRDGGPGCPHGFQRFGGPMHGGKWSGRPHGMMAPFEGHWYGGPLMMPQR